jgi:ATP-dependent DNA helicase Rep
VLKLLVGERGRFTAVSDDDQSIYGWRGATLDNLRAAGISELKVIKRARHRSTSAILRAANNVIQPNPKLFPKTLFSELGEGEPVRVVDCDNEEHEAERMVARFQSIRANGHGKDWKDFAVLYRANHQARVFEQALRKAQIPYKVSGGQSFFDRAEIRDLCAGFACGSTTTTTAFLRAITTPKRGIGHHAAASALFEQVQAVLFAALFSPRWPVLNPRRGQPARFGRYVNDLEFRARHPWRRDFGLHAGVAGTSTTKHLHEGEETTSRRAAG